MSPEGVSRKKRRRASPAASVVGLAVAAFGLAIGVRELVRIAGEHRALDHADQARRRASSRRTSPSTTTSAPTRTRPTRPASRASPPQPGTPTRQRPRPGAADSQPELGQPAAARPRRSRHLRPEPRLHRRAEGVRQRPDGQVRPSTPPAAAATDKSIVMDYYDGNTVTGLWNLRPALRAERQLLRHPVRPVDARRDQPDQRPDARRRRRQRSPASVENGTVIGDPDPALDDCGARRRSTMTGKNIGDLLNAHERHLGLVPGRLHADRQSTDGKAVCGSSAPQHRQRARSPTTSPHHEPFEYYASTANPHHLPPSSAGDDRRTPTTANHQYDLIGLRRPRWPHGNLPAVSFLKAAGVRGRPPGQLRPARRAALHRRNDQRARAVARSGRAPRSSSPTTTPTAGTTTSMPPIVSPSQSALDALNGAGDCGHVAGQLDRLPGPLRLRPAAAAAGDLAVREAELRRQHARPTRPRS